jgi:hypothetical protein
MILGPCDLVFKVSFIVLRMNDTESYAGNGKSKPWVAGMGRRQGFRKASALGLLIQRLRNE